MNLSHTSADRVVAVAEAISTPTTVLISTSHPADLTDLVIALEETDVAGEAKILTSSETISELREMFLTTARLVDYIRDDTIEIRARDSRLPSLIITEDSIGSVAGFPAANPAIVETTEPSVVKETTETFTEHFEAAEEVVFHKPSYTAMLDDLEERLENSLVEDFKMALEEAKAPEKPALQIHPVVVSILVGGYNETSFYQLSKWGEDVRIGSRAKFSRDKQALEEDGLIETAKIPRPVGRPRQRLLLGDVLAEEERIEDVVAMAIEHRSNNT